MSGAGDLILRGSSGGNTQILSGTNNSYTGKTVIQKGTLQVMSIKSVGPGNNSSLGAPTSVANGTIALGNSSDTGTLKYVGTGDTSDRKLNLAGTTGGGKIDQSGTGLLKFTSALTATGGGAKTLTLQGSTAGTGEMAGAIVNSVGGVTSLTKAGTGTWALSGTSTYTGDTTVSNGVLRLAAGAIAQAAGTWGPTGSGATHVDDTHFVGNGVLVVPGGSVYLIR
jgi:autotransporter-associated beta strand protein